MENLTNEVYQSLKSATAELEAKKADCAALQDKIDSGRYSEAAIKGYKEQLADLRRDIRSAGDAAIDEARQIVDEFEAAARRGMELDPAALTDDCRLLNAGIKLNEADISAMLRRNAGNMTMQQVISRFAAENGIKIAQHGFPEFAAKMDAAEAARGVISYFDRWIVEDTALTMLDKFFGVFGVEA